MEQLNNIIAGNLRKLRQDRGLSLAKLAELSGISNVLLSQIERGNSNPTIHTIWKIASGLKVPYSALIDTPQENFCLVTAKEAQANKQVAPDPRCSIACYYPLNNQRNFEVFEIRIESAGQYISPGHMEKSVEYIFVQSGSIEITIDNRIHQLNTGDSLSFASEREHIYHNTGNETALMLCINWYAPLVQ